MTQSLAQCIARARAVMFDFAGTLFDERSLREPMLENLRWLAGEVGMHCEDATLRKSYKRGLCEAYIKYMPRTGYRHDDFFGDCYRAAFADSPEPLSEALVSEAVRRQNHNTTMHLQLRPGCLETLAELRRAGKHVQVVSNFDEAPLVAALTASDVISHIDTWTSSERANSCKPDVGIFKTALSKAGCKAADTVYVGDAPMHDVAGARAAGIAAVLLDPDHRHANNENPDWQPDFRIASLTELCPQPATATA